MKKQNSAKGFKIIYFIISALWMVWWGALLYLVANTMEKRIFAFFVMLLPIPIYYILKGFFIGSKEIMKQPKYILIIVVLGIIAFVGWNKIDIFTKDKESQEVTLTCGPPEEEDFMIVNVSNGKMCFIDPTGQDQPICAEVEVNNSKTIKTISLDKTTSALARELQPEESKEEFYVKIDRTIGTLGFFYTADDVNIVKEGKVMPCKKKEKL